MEPLNNNGHAPFTTLLIDLDDTVYPNSAGVWNHIEVRMEDYMHLHLNIPREEVRALRHDLFVQYGTSLRGLQLTRHIDELEFLAYVHNVPIEELLTPDPALSTILSMYPQRKLIFTNADHHHARRVLSHLNMRHCFERVIDILDIAPYCKPMPEAFQIALKLAGESDPRRCVFIDDGTRNLAAAHALGFFTIRVGSRQSSPDYDAAILTLNELPSVLPPPAPPERNSDG